MSTTIDHAPSEPAPVTEPVRLQLLFVSQPSKLVDSDRRILQAPLPLVRHEGKVFVYGGTTLLGDGKWARVYREADVVDV